MKKKVLITGASGFVGYHLILQALERGLQVVAAVRKTSDTRHLAGLDIELLALDLLDASALQRQFEKDRYDFVIHAAGLTRARSLAEYLEANRTPSLRLAEAARAVPVEKFVFMSSLAVMGPIAYVDPGALCEDQLPKPVTNYGRSKLKAEEDLRQFEDLPWMILRPTAVYGPRERDLLILFRTLSRGLEPYIGKNPQHLSFIYVKDLAEMSIRALESEHTQEVYHLSDGQIYSRYAFSDAIKRALRKKTFKFHVPMALVRVIAQTLEATAKKKTPVLNVEKLNELAAENWSCSIDKAVTQLQFRPQYDLEKGIQETIRWYQENKWL